MWRCWYTPTLRWALRHRAIVLVGAGLFFVGIVVTNAIVLIDRVQANRQKRGMDAKEALVEGGRTRLRPILMTAVATILALMPLALGLTEPGITVQIAGRGVRCKAAADPRPVLAENCRRQRVPSSA